MPNSLFDQARPQPNRERTDSPRQAAQRSVERIEKVLDAVFENAKRAANRQ